MSNNRLRHRYKIPVKNQQCQSSGDRLFEEFYFYTQFIAILRGNLGKSTRKT